MKWMFNFFLSFVAVLGSGLFSLDAEAQTKQSRKKNSPVEQMLLDKTLLWEVRFITNGENLVFDSEKIVSQIRFLISKGANPNKKNENGETVIFEAVNNIVSQGISPRSVSSHQLGSIDVLTSLLGGRGDPNIFNKNGETALYVATKMLSLRLVMNKVEIPSHLVSVFEYLLRYGARLNIKSKHKETPLKLFEDSFQKYNQLKSINPVDRNVQKIKDVFDHYASLLCKAAFY